MNDMNRPPLPRRKLGPVITVLLWLLRIYVLIAVPLVVYAFIKALHQVP
jgi:hypothetical protein